MPYCFPHSHCISTLVKVASPSPSPLNFTLMPSKVKAKPDGLSSVGIVPLVIKQHEHQNTGTATFKPIEFILSA